MSDLTQIFLSLDNEQRQFVHFELCRNALGIWEDYAGGRAEIKYVESVVGTAQEVDKGLPREAFEAAKLGRDLDDIDWRYAEPISAMQDDDLEFPDHIEFAYYAIYNLFRKYVKDAKIDEWLICNQALSAETDPDKWQDLLNDAILKSL